MAEIKGLVTKGVGGTYTVLCDEGSDKVLCQIRGGFRKKRITPTVGDRVIIEDSGDPDIPYVIEKIMPRKNSLVRPPVANIDYIVLTFAVKDPEPDLKLLDKMLIICSSLDIVPIIVFTKADLDEESALSLMDVYSNAGYKCFVSYNDNRVDTDAIKEIVGDKVAGFAGPSGVGKSTLCNHLLEDDTMLVGDISDRLKRGKHTTRHVELFEFGEGFILDTPGFTSLDLFELGIDFEYVINGYPEIISASEDCRFSDCRHINERDCNVLSLLGKSINKDRYGRYKEFYEELYSKRNDYTRRPKV